MPKTRPKRPPAVRSKSHPVPDLDLIAAILVDAEISTAKDVLNKYKITHTTLSRYRKRLKTSPELLELVQEKLKFLQVVLRPPERPSVLSVVDAALEWLQTNIPRLHPSPDNVHAVVGAVKILKQSAMAERAMTEYINALKQQQLEQGFENTAATTEDGRSVPGSADGGAGKIAN